MIVLDTNVLSELMRKSPYKLVVDWVAGQPSPSLFTTTITQAEILYGISILPAGTRREGLLKAAETMFAVDFAGRLLPFDSAAARAYAEIASARRNAGKPISQFDAQIASIARSRGAAIASRNARDFHQCGPPVINPWNP